MLGAVVAPASARIFLQFAADNSTAGVGVALGFTRDRAAFGRGASIDRCGELQLGSCTLIGSSNGIARRHVAVYIGYPEDGSAPTLYPGRSDPGEADNIANARANAEGRCTSDSNLGPNRFCTCLVAVEESEESTNFHRSHSFNYENPPGRSGMINNAACRFYHNNTSVGVQCPSGTTRDDSVGLGIEGFVCEAPPPPPPVICSGTTPINENNVCVQATTIEQCESLPGGATSPIPAADGSCRPATSDSDCDTATGGARPEASGGACIEATPVSCSGTTPIDNGGTCEGADSVSDCESLPGGATSPIPTGNGDCRPAESNNECFSQAGGARPEESGGACIAATSDAGCPNNRPFYRPGTNGAIGNCHRMSEAGNPTAPVAIRCLGGPQPRFDVDVDLDDSENCTTILSNTPNGRNEGSNIPGVTVVLVGVYGGDRLFSIINNRTDGQTAAIDYANDYSDDHHLVPLRAEYPSVRLGDIGSGNNGEATPFRSQNGIVIGRGLVLGIRDGQRIGVQYYSVPQAPLVCSGTTPINENNVCIQATTVEQCQSLTDGADAPIPADDGSCRTPENFRECYMADPNAPIYDTEVSGAVKCRSATPDTLEEGAACNAANRLRPYRIPANDECRAPLNNAECGTIYPAEGNIYYDNSIEVNAEAEIYTKCRLPTDNEECAEISAAHPQFNNGACEEATDVSGCPTSRPFFDDNATGNCSAIDPTAEVCSGTTPISTEEGGCREAVSVEDCQGLLRTSPVPTGEGDCRPIGDNEDCALVFPTGTRVIFDSLATLADGLPCRGPSGANLQMEQDFLCFARTPSLPINIGGGRCGVPTEQSHCARVPDTGDFYDLDIAEDIKCRDPESNDECNEISSTNPQLMDDNTCAPATSELGCPIVRPFYEAVSANPGNCREANNASECPAHRSFFNNDGTVPGNCRPPIDNDECYGIDTANPQLMDDGTCAPATSNDGCPTSRPTYESDGSESENGNCRFPANFRECYAFNTDAPIYDSNQPGDIKCRAIQSGTEEGVVCNAATPSTPYRNPDGSCSAPGNNAECAAVYPPEGDVYYDAAQVVDGAATPTKCRPPRNNNECNDIDPAMTEAHTEDGDRIGRCRLATSDAGCPDVRFIYAQGHAQSIGDCRAALAHADCPAQNSFYHPTDSTDTGNCRQPTSTAECKMIDVNTPRLNNGICESVATHEECQDLDANEPILNGTGGCRAAAGQECENIVSANTPILNGSGGCRAATNNDECAAFVNTRTDEVNGACVLATDHSGCPTARPYYESGEGHPGDCRQVDDDPNECNEIDPTRTQPVQPNGTTCELATGPIGCPIIRPVFDETSTASIGNCRPATTLAECETNVGAEDPIPDPTGNGCRPAADSAECVTYTSGENPRRPVRIPDGETDAGGCRTAANSAECRDLVNPNTPIENGGDCIAATTTEECRALDAATPIPVTSGANAGSCRAATNNNDCQTNAGPNTPIADNGACIRATTVDQCRTLDAATPIPVTSGANAGSCRAANNSADCLARTAPTTPIAQNGACVAATTTEECQALDVNTPIFVNTGACRAASTDTGSGECRDLVGETTPISNGNGGCMAATNFSECVALDPNAPIAAASGACRAANNSADCLANTDSTTPIADNGACIAAATVDQCRALNAATPIPRSGECVAAANSAECLSVAGETTPIAQGGACVAATSVAQCRALNANTPIADGGRCRRATDSADCLANTASTTPIQQNGACIAAATTAQCQNLNQNTPIPVTSGANRGSCRAVAAAPTTECESLVSADTPVPNGNGGCRAASTNTASTECRDMVSANTPIPDGSGRCIAATNPTQCLALNANAPIAVTTGANTGSCRAAAAAPTTECRDLVSLTTPVPNGSGGCRAATNDNDCMTMVSTETPVRTSAGACVSTLNCGGTTPVARGGECVEAANSEECRTLVSQNTPIRNNDGSCRKATDNNDCQTNVGANTPIRESGGACRAATSSTDCRDNVGVTTPVQREGACVAANNNEECRTLVSQNLPINENDGSCRAATDNNDCQTNVGANTPIEDSGACRAANNSADCRDNVGANTPIEDSGACVAATTVAQCRALDATAPIPVESGANQGSCRAANNSADCLARTAPTTPIAQGGACVAATTTEQCQALDANTPIFVNTGACRAASTEPGSGDCRDMVSRTTPISNGAGGCMAATTSAQCVALNSNAPIAAASGECRAVAAAPTTECRDVSADTPVPNGNGGCRAASTNTASTECRDMVSANTPIPDGSGRCIAATTPAECLALNANAPVAVTTGANEGSCRAAAAAPTTECRNMVSAETPIPNGNGGCRAATDVNDCTTGVGTEYPVHTAEGGCNPVLTCSGTTPVADVPNNQCLQAATSEECRDLVSANTPIRQTDGSCRAAADNNECNAEFPATPQHDNGACEIATSDAGCPDARPTYENGAGTGNCRTPENFTECFAFDNTRPIYDEDVTGTIKCRAPEIPQGGVGVSNREFNLQCDLMDENTPEWNGTTCVAATSHDGCPPNRPVYQNGGGPGNCRLPNNDAECSMHDTNYDGNIFEVFHDSGSQHVDNCRYANNQAECSRQGGDQIYGPGTDFDNCRSPRDANDCIFLDNFGMFIHVPNALGSCRNALNDAECQQIYPSPDSTPPVTEVLPIFDGRESVRCRVPQSHAECASLPDVGVSGIYGNAGRYYDPDMAIDIANGIYTSCRAIADNDDCSDINMATPQLTGGTCEAATSAAGCPTARPFYAPGETGNCREARQPSECPMDRAFYIDDGSAADTGNCISPSSNEDCNTIDMAMPEFNSATGNCQAATSHAGCPSDRAFYVSDGSALATGNCRAPENNDDCDILSGMERPFLTTGGECQAATQTSECPTARPVYVSDGSLTNTGNCRMATGTQDCLDNVGMTRPIYMAGECRAATNNAQCEDLNEKMPVAADDGSCRVPNSNEECRQSDTDVEPIADSTEEDGCRYPNSHAECDDFGPNYNSAIPASQNEIFYDTNEGDNCRAPTNNNDCRVWSAAVNSGYTPYFVSSESDDPPCRAAMNVNECPDERPFYDETGAANTGNCRVPNNHAECADAKSGTGIYYDNTITDALKCRAPADNDDCSDIDMATPQLTGGACVAATSAAGCPTDRAFYVSDGSASATGNCRAPTSNDECDMLDNTMTRLNGNICVAASNNAGCPTARPRFDPDHAMSIGGCRVRLPDDCDDQNNPIFVSGECMPARNMADCRTTDRPIYDTLHADSIGNCRLPLDDSDCRADSTDTPIYDATLTDSIKCRAPRDNAECVRAPDAGDYFDNTLSGAVQCRAPTSNDECDEINMNMPQLTGGNCEAATSHAGCPTDRAFYETGNPGNCRAPTNNAECDTLSAMMLPFLENNICRAAAQHSECPVSRPFHHATDATATGNCRVPANQTECGQIGSNRMHDETADAEGDCRLREQTDCTDLPATPFLGDSGECRPAEGPGECLNTARPVYDPNDPMNEAQTTGNCRARRPNDCADSAPVFDASLSTNPPCRPARNPGECPADILPIFDESETGNCRVPRSDRECGDSMNPPIFDNTLPADTIQCRDPNNSGECNRADESMPFYDGSSCVAASSFAECPDSRPFYATDAIATGNCRLPASTAECGMLPNAGNDLFYDETQCRAPTSNDECDEINTAMPQENNGACQAATAISGCPTARPIYVSDGSAAATGNCRAPQSNNDCNLLNQSTPQHNNGACEIADRVTGCPTDRPVFDEGDPDSIGNCRPTRTGDCIDPMLPIFADGACRPANNMDECLTTAFPIYENGLTESGNCRTPRTNDECVDSANDVIFDNTLPADTIQCRLPNNDAECEIQDNLRPTQESRPIYDPADSAAVDNCRERRADDCAADPMLPYLNPESGMCEIATEESHCPSARPVFEDGLPDTGNCRLRESRDCEAANEVFDSRSVGGGVCLAPRTFLDTEQIAPLIANVYSVAECEDAGWNTGYAVQTVTTATTPERGNAAEYCIIPVRRDDSVPPAVAAREATSQQFENNGDTANGCLTRNSAGLTDADKAGYTPDISGIPNCNIDELFGNDGFPEAPAGFPTPEDVTTDPGDRRLVVAVRAGVNDIYDNGVLVPRFVRLIGGGGASGNAEDLAKFTGVFGGVLGVIAFVHYLSAGDAGADAFSFAPNFGYSITNDNGYSANVGGRAEYVIADWNLHWTARQTSTNGEFGEFYYASGARYDGDFWTAAFSESVRGETADYDLSLSADLRGNLWSLSPTYRFHASVETEETDSESALNLEGVLLYNRWTIRPSAGFEWRQFNEFGNNATFRLEAIRRF